MNYATLSFLACGALFAGMVAVYPVMHRLGARLGRAGRPTDGSELVSGAIYALLGLLIAFTLTGAYGRYDARRQLIVREANAIGSAYLLLDLLPADAQPTLRQLFGVYAAIRATLYDDLIDAQALEKDVERTAAVHGEIWARAVEATRGGQHDATRVVLMPALTQMSDIVTVRSVAVDTHPPLLIWAALFALALACSATTGFGAGMNDRPRFARNIAFALIVAGMLYVVLDIEFPRSGLARLDDVNQVLTDLARRIQANP